MRHLIVFGLALFVHILSSLTSPTWAWSEFGHLSVCDLAYRNLTDRSQDELQKLFQVDQGGIVVKARNGVEKRRYTSFNVGCLEEDEWPRKHPEDHFINVTRDTSKISSNACPGTKSCVLEGIERDLKILADASKSNEDRVFALMAVGHWIGDIHQPLHVSFGDDLGGNNIKVKLKGKCGTATSKPRKLHAMWDRCLLEAGMFEKVRQSPKYKKGWSRRTITYRAVDALQARTTLAEERIIVTGNAWDWANASLQITISPEVQYCVQVGDKCQFTQDRVTYKKDHRPTLELGQEYLEKFKDVAEERIRLAGFRLAHLVNQALDPDYEEPKLNTGQKLEE